MRSSMTGFNTTPLRGSVPGWAGCFAFQEGREDAGRETGRKEGRKEGRMLHEKEKKKKGDGYGRWEKGEGETRTKRIGERGGGWARIHNRRTTGRTDLRRW
jgi:hypothetical protein